METASTLLTATRLARETLGLPETGTASPTAFLCPLCGSRKAAGAIGLPFPFSTNFSDWPNLTGIYGEHGEAVKLPTVCGDCIAFMNKPMMALVGAALFTRNGGFGLRSDEAKTTTSTQTVLNLILYPPEPPFVATINSGGPGSLAHLIWRTPITLDRRLIRLRYGGRLLSIRRHLIEAALAISERLGLKGGVPRDPAAAKAVAAAEARGEEWTRYRALRRLFAPNALDFKISAFQTGQPSLEVLDACTPAERNLLLTLGLGEHFALNYLASNRPPAPPPPLRFPGLGKTGQGDLAAV